MLDGIDYDIVCTYAAQDVADPWKCNDPGVPAFLNDLLQMEPGKGYLISPQDDATLAVSSVNPGTEGAGIVLGAGLAAPLALGGLYWGWRRTRK